MAASDGGHVWPPRASDLRIQELTGAGPEGSTPGHVFKVLRAAGYTGSLDDMWKQHKAALGVTDTSEPFTTSIATGPGSDPYWDNVILLVDMSAIADTTQLDDTNCGDLSASNHTLGWETGITASTTVGGNFGTSAGKVNNPARECTLTGDNVISDFTFGTSDFTIEYWAYNVGWTAAGFCGLAMQAVGGGSSVYENAYTSASSGTDMVFVNSGALYDNHNYAHTDWPTAFNGTWVHFAQVRDGNVYRRYVNGVEVDSIAFNYDIAAPQAVRFFNSFSGLGPAQATTYVEQLRITKGVARYTEDFTPPTELFPTS